MHTSTLQTHAPRAFAPNPPAGDTPVASFAQLERLLRDARQDPRRDAVAGWVRQGGEAAVNARRAGACDALITAALLHRLGDLVAAQGDPQPRKSAAALAHLGADLLVDLYPPLVTESVRLQAGARRYLASSASARVAGERARAGEHADAFRMPMGELERECFAALPFAMNAVKVCRWTLTPPTDCALEREWPTLLRIAERSVCNDGFGWSS